MTNVLHIPEPAIWYSASLKEWWMDDIDPRVAREKLASVEDAIRITNPEELPTSFRIAMMEKAGRL